MRARGRHGFHIHVRDFKVRDWTFYDPGKPLKSHEVARRKYVEMLNEYAPEAFDKSHYVLSCDVTRVMTLPETLNGETGLICSAYDLSQFKLKSVKDIVEKARGRKHITERANWQLATKWKNPRYNLLSP